MTPLAWLDDEPETCIKNRIRLDMAVAYFWKLAAVKAVPSEREVIEARAARAWGRYNAVRSRFHRLFLELVDEDRHRTHPWHLSDETHARLRIIAVRIAPQSEAARLARLATIYEPVASPAKPVRRKKKPTSVHTQVLEEIRLHAQVMKDHGTLRTVNQILRNGAPETSVVNFINTHYPDAST